MIIKKLRTKFVKKLQKAARGAVIISLSLVNRRSWRARDIGMVDTCCLWGGSNISKSACAGGRAGAKIRGNGDEGNGDNI